MRGGDGRVGSRVRGARRTVRASLAVMVLLAAAACQRDATQPGGEALGYKLKLGATVPFTGDISTFGEPSAEAMKIGVEIVKEAIKRKGLDVDVELVVEDDRSNASAGVEAATKLVRVDRANILLSSIASAVTIPIAESVAVPNNVVMIVPIATSAAIGDLRDDGLVFRTAPPDSIQGRVLARVIADELSPTALVNTGTRNDAYGVALVGVFEDAWKKGGGRVGKSVKWNPGAATFDSEAQELAGGSPEGWVVIDFPETWAKVGPALVRSGKWDVRRTFTTDALATGSLPNVAGREVTEGMRGTVPTSAGAVADAFDQEWKKRTTVVRHAFDANAFDAVIVAFLSTLAAKGTDADVVKTKVIDLTRPPGEKYSFVQLDGAIDDVLAGKDIDYQGASGPIDMDDRGDPTISAYEMWTFREGKIQTLRVLQPEQIR